MTIEKIINFQIDIRMKEIKRNEKLQSVYEAKHGKSDPVLYAEHDKLCDEIEALCNQRRAMNLV